MPRNGAGVYTPSAADNPVVANTLIEATKFNNTIDDIAAAITGSVAADGQTTITANLPMATYRHTGVGNAAARTDYAAAGQVQDGKLNWVDGGGTADAITATYSPAITALVDGQECCVRATAANATTTPTFSPNGLTARTIVKGAGSALLAGDIAGDQFEAILRYDLVNTRWTLLNPATGIGRAASGANTDITSLSGDITNATKAAFLANNSALQSNVTGNGVAYSVPLGTEVFDRGSDFASSTFTAPVTGVYQLDAAVQLDGLTATNTDALLQIVTSNRSYPHYYNPGAVEASATYGVGSASISVLADMDAGDTAIVQITVQQGTQVVGLSGGLGTRFSGYLVG